MRIFDVLFPPRCVGCKNIGNVLCDTCMKQCLPTLHHVCVYCFYPSPEGKTHTRCQGKTSIDNALAVIRYTSVARNIIKEAKYRLAFHILNMFFQKAPTHWFDAIIKHVKSLDDPVLCPIPLSRERHNKRGFNQAEIIMKFFESVTHAKTDHLLIRTRNTPPQAMQRTKKERKQNIKGVFSLRDSSQAPKTVVLVDDLFTSASTAQEAAHTLKKTGARHISLLALAHGN